MTIKEVSERAGVSHQAIYKRLRTRGIRAEDITEKSSGQLTGKGEELIKELFPFLRDEEGGAAAQSPQDVPADPPETEEKAGDEGLQPEVARLQEKVARLQEEVARLQPEVAGLKGQIIEYEKRVATLEESNRLLTDERDYLRKALDQSQQLQAMTAQKIPTPPAITDGSERKQKRGLWERLTGRKEPKS